MLYSPGFFYFKKLERLHSELLSEDKITNHLVFFDIIKPMRIEHLQSEEPFSSDPYFKEKILRIVILHILLRLEPNKKTF